MKYKLVLIMIILLVLSLSTAFAGNELRTGTAGAQELRIPIGSRGAAMGGAILSTVSGVESMYYNPAGLASLEGTEAMFTHIPYFADININFVGVAKQIEGFGTVGFGAKIVNIGTMEETTVDFPDGTGRDFSPTFSVMNLSYSKVLTANVSFGLSALYINETIFEASASGIAFDVGFIYNPRWNGMSLGVTIKNYGAEMEFDGIGFDQPIQGIPYRPVANKFDLPSSINIGMAYDLMNEGPNFATLNGSFQSNNYSQDVWNGGAEYVYDSKFAIRAGYNYSTQEDYIYGFTFGGGLTFPMGEDATLSLDYTWTETDVDAFDANQYFTLRANF